MVRPNASKSMGRPELMLAPPSTQAMINARPCATYMVPKVAITGVICSLTTKKPLMMPKQAPINITRMIEMFVGIPNLHR